MHPEAIRAVLVRDLGSLARQVEAYPDDELPWRLVPGIANSAGTLTLHLAGNLQHYIGSVLGGTGYVRDRAREFGARGLTRAELKAEVEAAREAVDRTLASLAPERSAAEYPEPVGGRAVRTADFLVHLVVHFGYHLGQIDYHRRMLVPGAGPIPMISVRELPAPG